MGAVLCHLIKSFEVHGGESLEDLSVLRLLCRFSLERVGIDGWSSQLCFHFKVLVIQRERSKILTNINMCAYANWLSDFCGQTLIYKVAFVILFMGVVTRKV